MYPDFAKNQTNSKNPAEPASPSILIILMGSLGDIARGLCLVCHIKDYLPQSRLSWLVEPKWAELVRLHRKIDKVIIFERAWRFASLWKLYKNLNAEHFDVTLDLQRILKSGFFSLLSGAGRRIGFNRRNAKEFNWIFNNEHIGYYSDNLAKYRHYLKFTESLGLPEPDTLDFGLASLNENEASPRAVAALKGPFIAIVLGASWQSKDWYPGGYLELIRHILFTLKRKVVLLGDDTRVQLAKELSRKVGQAALINIAGQTSLLQLAAVLKKAAAGIGPDSGPGHLAAAVGTPYVSLFGPTSPERTAPLGYEDLVVTAAASCGPCYKKKCPEHHTACMNDIKPEQVIEKLTKALEMRRMG